MPTVAIGTDRPGCGLLVSVRDADEARAALSGGAEVIDVKEPQNGPLGAASRSVIAEIVETVGGRRPVTVALGELADQPDLGLVVEGIAVAKVGLAGSCRSDWGAGIASLRRGLPHGVELAMAAYLDYEAAASPAPEEVLQATINAGGGWLVLDTWDKSGPSSLSLGPDGWLAGLCRRAAEGGVPCVLAGRLGLENVPAAWACGPRLIGVRGAACEGGRAGRVAAERVQTLAQQLAGCRSNQ